MAHLQNLMVYHCYKLLIYYNLPDSIPRTPGANIWAPRKTAAPHLASIITSFSFNGTSSFDFQLCTMIVSFSMLCTSTFGTFLEYLIER